MEDVLNSLDKNVLIVILVVAVKVILIFVGVLWKQNSRMFKEMINRFELLDINQQATDYAIGKEFGNGYEGYRDSKKAELMQDYNFTKQGK